MKTSKTTALIVATAILQLVGTTQAAIFSNFEPPTYTSGLTINGVDGWTGNGNEIVTPYPAGDPYGSGVLEGTQSMWMLWDYAYRGWSNSAVAGLINTNSTYVSWLLDRPKGFGRSILYLWDGPAFYTPAGLGMGTNGNFEVFGKDPDSLAAVTDSGVAYDTNKVYRLGMLFDFTNNTFAAFAQDVTDGGPLNYLGTYLTYHAGSWDINSLRNNGGLYIVDDKAGNFSLTASVWDDIQVVPEPSSALLLTLGGLLFIRRRG